MADTTIGVTPDAAKDIFPFLQLPGELRNEIYRMLLHARYTLVSLQPLQRFGMHPAILRVSRQLYEEAKGILYHENKFVAFHLQKTAAVQYHGFFHKVAALKRLQVGHAVNLVLDITVGNVDEPCGSSVMTTWQSLPFIAQCLWDIANFAAFHQKPHLALGQMVLSLTCHPPLCKSQDLWMPFCTLLYALGTVSITGTDDRTHTDRIIKHMTSLPVPATIDDPQDWSLARAEQAYAAEDYALARQHCTFVLNYRRFMHSVTATPRHLATAREYLIQRRLVSTEAKSLTAQLGAVKASLQLGDHDAVLRMPAATLQPHSHRGDTFLLGQIGLGRVLAQLAAGRLADATTYLAQALQRMRVDPRYAPFVLDVFSDASKLVSDAPPDAHALLAIILDPAWDLLETAYVYPPGNHYR
ncbi:hypothetical protein MMC19_001572 [Ptychographa xylographoides]|nr:hypothetical protein [Ptychographa xylographoides]